MSAVLNRQGEIPELACKIASWSEGHRYFWSFSKHRNLAICVDKHVQMPEHATEAARSVPTAGNIASAGKSNQLKQDAHCTWLFNRVQFSPSQHPCAALLWNFSEHSEKVMLANWNLNKQLNKRWTLLHREISTSCQGFFGVSFTFLTCHPF